jgi:hypothetical protein
MLRLEIQIMDTGCIDLDLDLLATLDAPLAERNVTKAATWLRLSLDEARQKCEAWRTNYNDVRSRSSIGNKTPGELHSPPLQSGPANEAGIFWPTRSNVGGKFSRSETNIRLGSPNGG